jgi:hypothetical protein
MKKYKLITTYPGSPSLGTLAWKDTTKHSGEHITDDKWKGKILSSDIFTYPEFWKEVQVEKNYEILQMRNLVCDIYTLDVNEEIGKYESTHHKIHSIKRLSDDEIFTIGDNVTHVNYTWDSCFIKEFIIKENNLKFDIIQNNNIASYDLKILKHTKKPLFITKDGILIFKGDKYFQVGFKFNNIECEAYDKNNFDKKLIIFSTKKAAEEYILMNKPCLSVNEIAPIISVCNNITHVDLDLLIEKLKNLVKVI